MNLKGQRGNLVGRRGWDGRGPSELGGTRPVRESPIYKQHRIHTTRLPSGPWIGLIVNLGRGQSPPRTPSRTRHACAGGIPIGG